MKKILIALLVACCFSCLASTIEFCQNQYDSSDERKIAVDQLRSLTHFESFTDFLQIEVQSNSAQVHKDGLLVCNDNDDSYILLSDAKIGFTSLKECNETIRLIRDNLSSLFKVSYDEDSVFVAIKVNSDSYCQ